MQKASCFIISLLLLIGCSKKDALPQSTWKVLSANSTNDLVDIHFSGNNFGIACGAFGTLLKTHDAGKTWQNLDVGVLHSFLAAFAIDSNEFAVARIGLFKTINSGDSFFELGNLGSFGASITGIHFFSSEKAIVQKGSSVYLTDDGGNSWGAVYAHQGNTRMLEIADNNTVFIAGGRTFDAVKEGEMHKSIDNGETWAPMTLPGEIAGSEITAIAFLSSQTGYISTFENKIFKTTDGGQNWIKKADLTFGPIFDLLFVSESTGYLISQNKIYRTTNGGEEWKEEFQVAPDITLSSLTMSANGSLYVSGMNGTILKKVN